MSPTDSENVSGDRDLTECWKCGTDAPEAPVSCPNCGELINEWRLYA